MADVVSKELRCDVRLEPVPTYPDTIVYEVDAAFGSVIFKAIDPDGRDPDGIALEAWACEKARDVGVPAPAILSVDTTKARFPGSFFIMEKATGVPVERLTITDAQRESVLTELGSHLRALHEVRVPGFGWLDEEAFRASGNVRGRDETWAHALLGSIPESLEYLSEPDRLTSAEVSRARTVIDAGTQIVESCTDGRLIHGDIGLLHVWADPRALRVSSVVDFGERAAGDPASDFGDLEGRQLRWVLAGYDTDDVEELVARISFYSLTRAIPWARKWHSRGESQVLAWVRHVLAAAPTF